MPSRIAEWLRPRSSALKLYLFFINLLFLLFGIALIAVSIYVSLNRANTPELVGNYLFNAAVYVVLFAIILLFVTSLVGHFAIAKYSRVLLLLYAVLLIIMLLLLFGGGVSLAVFPTIFQATVISTMNESLTKEYGKRGIVTDAWNFVQSQLRCCAVLDNGWIAYRGSWWDHSVNVDIFAMSSKLSENSYFYKLVPISCCLTIIDPLTGWPTDVYRSITQCQNWQYGPPRFENGAHNDAIYYRGCFSAIKSYLERYSRPIAGLSIFMFFLLLFAVVVSVLLLRNMDRNMKQRKAPI